MSYTEQGSEDEADSGTEFNADDEDDEDEPKKTGRTRKLAKRGESKEEEDDHPAEQRFTKKTGAKKKTTTATAADSPVISHFTQKMLENPTKKMAAMKKSASLDSDSEDEYRNVRGERSTSAKFEVSVFTA